MGEGVLRPCTFETQRIIRDASHRQRVLFICFIDGATCR